MSESTHIPFLIDNGMWLNEHINEQTNTYLNKLTFEETNEDINVQITEWTYKQTFEQMNACLCLKILNCWAIL